MGGGLEEEQERVSCERLDVQSRLTPRCAAWLRSGGCHVCMMYGRGRVGLVLGNVFGGSWYCVSLLWFVCSAMLCIVIYISENYRRGRGVEEGCTSVETLMYLCFRGCFFCATFPGEIDTYLSVRFGLLV